MENIITGIIGLFSGFIGSLFLYKKDDKNNQLSYITEERRKWRNKLRKLVVEFLDKDKKNQPEGKLSRIRTEIAINLNPNDKKDNDILYLMDYYIKNSETGNVVSMNILRDRITVCFSSLLKHDWDRVKQEAKSEKIITTTKILLFLIIIFLIYRFYNEVYVKSNGCPLLLYYYLNYELFFNFMIFLLVLFGYFNFKIIIFYIKNILENNNSNFFESVLKYFGLIKRK